MSSNLIVTDLQQLDSGASPYIELFELQVDTNNYVYFTNYLKEMGPIGSPAGTNIIQFRDYVNNSQINAYYPIPAKLSGIEHKLEGQLPQPVLEIANVLKSSGKKSLQGLIENLRFSDLLGLKFIRRRTLKKYLFGEAGDSSPPVELPRDVYYLDRIEEENPSSVSFILVSPVDLTGVVVPRRIIIGNSCPWKFQGAAIDLNEWEKVGGCAWHTQGQVAKGDVEQNFYVNIDDEYVISNAISTPTYSGGAVNNQDLYKTIKFGLTKIQPNGTLSLDTPFSAPGNVNTSTDELTLTGHNFITGDFVYYTNGGGDIGLTDATGYYLNVSGSLLKFYDTEANAVTGGAGGLQDLNASTGTGHNLSPAEWDYWQARSASGSPGTPSDTDSDWTRVRIYKPTYSSQTATAMKVFTDDRYNTYVTDSSLLWKSIGVSQTPNGHVESPQFGSFWERGDLCAKHLTSCAKRYGVNPIFTLAYDAQTVNFTVGNTIVGQSSGARGIIIADADSGSPGTLTLSHTSGRFLDNEIITELNGTGSATVNGWLSSSVAKPHTEPDKESILPFGGFPTARVFS